MELRKSLRLSPVRVTSSRLKPYFLVLMPLKRSYDLFKGINTKKYGFKRDDVTLTGESRKDFLNSMNLYSKLEARRKDEEAKVCALITSSFSEEASSST